MTNPANDPNSRISATAQMVGAPNTFREFGRLIIAVALMAFGGYFLYFEMKNPPTHNGHIYLFSGITVFGAVLLDPAYLLGTASQVVVIVVKVLPWKRGDS